MTALFSSASGQLDPSDPGAFSVLIGADDQGAVTEVEYRSFTRQEGDQTVTYHFARIARDDVADYLLIPIDPANGQIRSALLPAADDYAAGDLFTPVNIQMAVNQAPSAGTDTDTVDEDGSVLIDVLTNDTDPEDDALSIVSVDDGANGTAVISNGQIEYTPDADFFGDDSFTYTISDGISTAQGTVNVTVTGLPDDPIARNDSPSTDEGKSRTINMLSNDEDPDGDSFTLLSVDTTGTIGTVEVLDDGRVRYDPGDNFEYLVTGQTAEDVFTYIIEDSTGRTDPATVRVQIDGINDLPLLDVPETQFAFFEPPEATSFLTVTGDDVETPADLVLSLVGPDSGAFTILNQNASGTGLEAQIGFNLDAQDLPVPALSGPGRYEFALALTDGLDTTLQHILVQVPGPDAIIGSNDPDQLQGTDRNDQIFGRDGDDVIIGSAGRDSINGGAGVDMVDYSTSATGIFSIMDFGYARTTGKRDELIKIESLAGSNQRDVLIGGADTVLLKGNGGNDVLRMRDTADARMEGGGGADKITGGDGNETIFGDAGNDVIQSGRGNDTVELGTGNDIARTSSGVDNVRGEDGDDVLRLGSENDVGYGDAGADRLFGNFGNDLLYGGADNDRVDGGAGADVLFGEDGNDALRGGSGQDVIDGGAGDDNLYGGTDTTGDGNRDTFVFRAGDLGDNRIKDFEDGRDQLDLTDFGFADFAAVLAVASSVGGSNTRLDLDTGISVVIENLDISNFDATDIL